MDYLRERQQIAEGHIAASLVVEDDPEAGPLFMCRPLSDELLAATEAYAAKYLDCFGVLPLGAHQLPGATTIVMLPVQEWRPKR